MKIIAQNKKARFEYEILTEYEAGIALLGSEIKALRSGRANIAEGYITQDDSGGLSILNMNIPVYNMSSQYLNHSPNRKRRLLLKQKEINKIVGGIKTKGITVIPLMLYINDRNLAKLQIAVAKGKTLFDKRETIKERDWKRDKEIFNKEFNR